MSYNLTRRVSVRIDALRGTYLIYGRPVGAGNTGFSLNQAVEFCTMILL